jgi:hypothetical protein
LEDAGASPPSPVPTRRDRLPALWLAGAFVLLLFPFAQWLAIPRGYRLVATGTPLDGTRPDLAAEWRFLALARPLVPRGARLTVIAKDDGTEMELFMLAFGLFPDCRPVPTTYFAKPHALGKTAEYVLAFDGDAPEEPAVLVGKVPGGSVWRRGGAK